MYTSESFDKFIQYLEDGHSRKDARRLSGVSDAVFRSWMKGTTETHRKHMVEIQAAESRAVERHLKVINTSNNYKASAWMLERLRPERFGKPDGRDTTPTPQIPALNAPQAKERLFQLAMKLCLEDPAYNARLKEFAATGQLILEGELETPQLTE